MTKEDILKYGVAPNAELNSTIASALQMREYFKKLLTGTAAIVGSILINTTIPTPKEANLIPIEEVEGLLLETKLYLHLQVYSPALGDQTKWSVVSWERAVKYRGLDLATRDYMSMILPGATYVDLPSMLTSFTGKLDQLYKTGILG